MGTQDPNRYPVAGARLESYRGTRQLFVYACPFCKKSHRHGAGLDGEPLAPYLGARSQYCLPPYDAPVTYTLRVTDSVSHNPK